MAETLHLYRKLDEKPLIASSLFNSLLFTACVALFSVVESLIRSFIHGESPMGAVDELINELNYDWLARAFAVFFAFVPYFALRGLRQVLGGETMRKLFFEGRSAQASV